MIEKMKSDWNRSAGGERQGKADHTSRAQEEGSSAGVCDIFYNRKGARLWKDRFNRETRVKTERDKKERERDSDCKIEKERERERGAQQGL
jgi:hypothetical protein